MPIIILIAAILILLLLITLLKLNAFVSLTIASLFVGLANGMELQKIIVSVTSGIGTTLGSLVLIMGFGAMLGSLLSETGAAQKISAGLINFFGVRRAKYAILLVGFVVGIAMFYNAGFIVIIPLAFSLAASTGQPLVYLSVAMASALSVTHGFLPPHPGPTSIAVIFKADIGKTLLYGIIIAIPAMVIAGIVFPEFLKKIKAAPPSAMFADKHFSYNELPGFGISLFTALIPVLLMGLATVCELLMSGNNKYLKILKFIGDPGLALLIAVLCAIALLGTKWGMSRKVLMNKTAGAVNAIAMILLVIAAGGAFKQVLVDSGTGTAITDYLRHSALSPLFLGWLIATIIRISIGSATVSGLTAAAIVQPLITATHVKPELMVLSVGAGSLMCSHVNDTGFWMFKEYLGLSVADTFKSWTIMETIVGVVGLAGVLILNFFL